MDMAKDGCILLLTVFNHNRIANNFTGICVVDCKHIPHLDSFQASSHPNTPQPKNFNLPLFHLTTKTAMLSELHIRSILGESEATEFFKQNRKVLGLKWWQFQRFTWDTNLIQKLGFRTVLSNIAYVIMYCFV